MFPIICKNETGILVKKIEEYLSSDKILKDIKLVETTKDQIVVILHNEKITDEKAEIFWSGYQAGLKQALE